MRFLLILGLACGLAAGTAAQGLSGKPAATTRPEVDVQIEAFQDRFLPGEAIVVEFRLRNLSGQPLTFKPEDDWLDVNIWSVTKSTGEGSPAAQLKPVRINETFTIPHTKAIKARVDIAPCFNLMRPGRFKLNAAIVHPGARTPVQATPILLEIVPGSKMWEQEFGFRPLGSDAPPELRKYALQKMTTKNEVRLYVSVTDAAEDTVFRQLSLGRVANSDQPQRRLDRLSNLHVIHQTGPRTFTHTVINPNGDILRRATFDSMSATIRPVLRPDEEGRITVTGGVRHPRSDDIPAAVAEPVPPPPPAALP